MLGCVCHWQHTGWEHGKLCSTLEYVNQHKDFVYEKKHSKLVFASLLQKDWVSVLPGRVFDHHLWWKFDQQNQHHCYGMGCYSVLLLGLACQVAPICHSIWKCKTKNEENISIDGKATHSYLYSFSLSIIMTLFPVCSLTQVTGPLVSLVVLMYPLWGPFMTMTVVPMWQSCHTTHWCNQGWVHLQWQISANLHNVTQWCKGSSLFDENITILYYILIVQEDEEWLMSMEYPTFPSLQIVDENMHSKSDRRLFT